MKRQNYYLHRDSKTGSITYLEYDKIDGFNMTSKNKNIKLKDAINVNKMVIINPSFIEKLIDKNINKKIKKLIDMLANIYDIDDEDPSGALMEALNEVEKFKREMINKYLNYMTKEQVDILEKKVQILETEVLQYAYRLNEQRYLYYNNQYDEYETKKSR